jgi:hypothetical protein
VNDSRFLSAQDVLGLWCANYRIELTPALRAQFLVHPAMDRITSHSNGRVEAELPHHQRLDDLASALDLPCHDQG